MPLHPYKSPPFLLHIQHIDRLALHTFQDSQHGIRSTSVTSLREDQEQHATYSSIISIHQTTCASESGVMSSSNQCCLSSNHLISEQTRQVVSSQRLPEPFQQVRLVTISSRVSPIYCPIQVTPPPLSCENESCIFLRP